MNAHVLQISSAPKRSSVWGAGEPGRFMAKPRTSKTKSNPLRAQRTNRKADVTMAPGGRFRGPALRSAVQQLCMRDFSEGLGVEIATAKGTSAEHWDDWWRCQLLGLRSPSDDSRMYVGKRELTNNSRVRIVWSLEQYDIFGLPPLPDQPELGRYASARFLTRHELAVISLLCGNWPSVHKDELLSAAQVIAREEKLMEKLSLRYGPSPGYEIENNDELDREETLQVYDPEVGKYVPNPRIRWVKRKVRRGRKG